MGLVLDCPERVLRYRVKEVCITESCEWQGITVTRLTQGQYQIEGHGQTQKVGSGVMRIEAAQQQVVEAVLALHQQHIDALPAVADGQVLPPAPVEAPVPPKPIRRRQRLPRVHPKQLSLWGAV